MRDTKNSAHRNRPYPKEGPSRIYTVFKQLMDNKGHPVKFNMSSHLERVILDLKDYYCMDIIHMGPKTYKLIGEWNGDKYIDYSEIEMVDDERRKCA